MADFETDLVVFLQRLEAAGLNGLEVNEKVLAAVIRRNEAEALGVVEPLNGTCTHVCFLGINLREGPEALRRIKEEKIQPDEHSANATT